MTDYVDHFDYLLDFCRVLRWAGGDHVGRSAFFSAEGGKVRRCVNEEKAV
jgi:hypothetical protein